MLSVRNEAPARIRAIMQYRRVPPISDSLNVAQFIEHPQLKGRDRWREVESPVGTLQALLPPMNLEGFAGRMDPIPSVGQQTDEILAEIGYDAEAIRGLHERNAIQ